MPEQVTSEEITLERVQELVTRGPFHQWLGLKVVAVHDDGIELTAKWREEWVVNPDRGYTHGGVLATLVDLAADWAMVKKLGRGVPTIDLRVDHRRRHAWRSHRPRQGAPRRLSTAEASIYDAKGKLIASGRGTYFTAPPKA